MTMSPLTQQLLMGPPESRAGNPQPKKNPIDTFLNTPGGSFLMNLLAQSGYSPVPQSEFGAIGRAALMTQAQGRQREQDALREALVRSQIGFNERRGRAADRGPETPSDVRSFREFETLADGSTPDRTRDPETKLSPAQERWLLFRRSPSLISEPGVGVQQVGAGGGTREIIPEEEIVGGIEQRSLTESEAKRGRVMDDTGVLTPVPGSDAAIEEEEGRRQREAGSLLKSIQAQTVVEDISRLNMQISAGEVPFGRTAAIYEELSPVLQPDGYRNAVALIESVKGNVGVDSLIRIKQSGAGLGQVPQTQLDLLSRLLGELSLRQEKEQFMDTWNRTGKVYQEIWDAADEEMREVGAVPPSVFQPLDQESAQSRIDAL